MIESLRRRLEQRVAQGLSSWRYAWGCRFVRASMRAATHGQLGYRTANRGPIVSVRPPGVRSEQHGIEKGDGPQDQRSHRHPYREPHARPRDRARPVRRHKSTLGRWLPAGPTGNHRRRPRSHPHCPLRRSLSPLHIWMLARIDRATPEILHRWLQADQPHLSLEAALRECAERISLPPAYPPSRGMAQQVDTTFKSLFRRSPSADG